MAEAFPRLTESSYRTTSPSDVRYNCVAWAAEDIEHDCPDDVAGGLYGEVVQYMRRARPNAE